MLKKILTIIAAVTVFAALFTVSVSAAEYLNQDFENGVDVFLADTPPAGAARVEVTEDENAVVFFDNTTANNLVNRINSSVSGLSKGGVMMFDFKKGQRVDNGYIYVELNGGTIDGAKPKCVLNISALSHDEGTWYSYVMVMSEGATEGTVYRKRRDVDEPYGFVVNTSIATTGEATAMWRMYCMKHSGYFDNIRIFDGVFAKDILFNMDGNEVSRIEDITAGTFRADMKIVCGDVTKATDNGGTIYFAKGASATPVMVFFDKNMRMVNCTHSVNELNVGDNAVSLEVDTTDFADKLDGGFAGLYVLDDMMNIRPLADAVELR